MTTLTTPDGTRLCYRVRGSGRPALVFVHGWCSNLTHWNAQIRYFARRHRVLALDRRGHGRSDVPDEGYTTEQHAADLAGVLRKERVRSAVIVGHAGGGAATLELAHAYPHLARAVVLVDSRVGPSVRVGDRGDPAWAALGGLIDRIRGERGAAEFVKIYREFFSKPAGRIAREAIAAAARTPREVAAAELLSLASGTQRIAEQLTQPVLWLSVSGADERALSGIFRDVQFGQLVGSGHFPQLEVPDQTNAMIDRFVSNL
jgi:pimeloyl-ACP methyl ester carboxylesterase